MEVYNKKILIVDSERIIRQVLATRLTTLGYSVFLASNGDDALVTFDIEQPHLIILDIMLPKSDGYEVCRKIRENSKIPIIILSARDGISDRILGLEIGANDYLTKPFSPKELEVRTRSILRREDLETTNSINVDSNTLQIGDLILYTDKKQVVNNNIKVKLTNIEFSLLLLLIKNTGKNLSRAVLLENVWGYTPERYIDTRVVDVHISRLRAKLKKTSKNSDFILTVRGTGYMFQSY